MTYLEQWVAETLVVDVLLLLMLLYIVLLLVGLFHRHLGLNLDIVHHYVIYCDALG